MRKRELPVWVPWGLAAVGAGVLAWWLTKPPEHARHDDGGYSVDVEVVGDDDGGRDAGPTCDVVTETSREHLMGTEWKIGVYGCDATRAQATSERALDEVARLEALLSEWQSTSEISAVNHAAGEHPVHVGPELWACVQASLDVARWSDGAFDISWAALRDLWDFSEHGSQRPPTLAQVRARLPLWNWRHIVTDEVAQTIFLTTRGMQIGLGGVAKGYALDEAARILRTDGFEDFVIFGGGQVLVGGMHGTRPWRVGIQHPRDPTRYVAFVEVSGPMSVSTSGDYEHMFTYEGRRYHHILDPHTGFPSENTASVTLLTPTGLWADAVDTAAFILGPARAVRMLATAPGGPHEAIFIDPELRLSTTPGTERRLVMRATLGAEHRIGAWQEPDADAPVVPLPPLPPPPEAPRAP